MRYVLVLLGLFASYCFAKPLDLPPELKPWQQWVLYDHPDAACPFINQNKTRACVWPSALVINADNQQASFEMQVEVFSDSFIPLPGGSHLWPTAVKNQDGVLPVSAKDAMPMAFVAAGIHTIYGTFNWQSMPLSLPTPNALGLLQLTLNGKTIASPNRDKQGNLWLREPERAAAETKEADTFTAKVFRKLSDDIPQVLDTRLLIRVSGQQREVVLGPILLPGFTPQLLESELPARVEPNGQLRLQVEPGEYEITLLAHSVAMQTHLQVAPIGDLWPRQEIWAFAAERSLRTVQIEGAAVVDSSQTEMPSEWLDLPAYLITPEVTLNIEEQHRGDPTPAVNDLALDKALWLDFAGHGFTVKDTLTGTMHQGWRLAVNPPYQLGRVDLNEEPQLITTLTENGAAGVEVRERDLAMTAVSRMAWYSTIPVTGWNQEFNQVEATLHLPQGWAALHVSGADWVSGSWLAGWNLWDIFLVLVIAVSLWRAVNLPTGLLALATLVVVYQRTDAPLFGWLNLAACLALLPYIKGRFGQWLNGYLALSFVGLALLILPFFVHQARLAIYPQLETQTSSFDFGYANNKTYSADSLQRVSPASVAESKAKSGAELEEVIVTGIRQSKVTSNLFHATYNANQKIQVGPGLPDWQWQTVTAHWSGPVAANDTTQFILSPPWLTRLGHFLAIILVGALLAGLAYRFWCSNPRQYWPNTGSASATAALLLLLFAALPNPDAHADVVIDNSLLNTLKERLLAPPDCLPQCAAIEAVTLDTHDEQLNLTMVINTQSSVGVALPGNLNQWWPTEVTSANGDRPNTQTRDGHLWVLLKGGRHTLTLKGPLAGLDAASLNFQQPLHNVTLQTPGWTLSGLPTQHQSSSTLLLQREEKSALANQNKLTPAAIAPFVIVKRYLELGLEWTMHTEVTRVAPSEGAIHLSIPLIKGEAPTSGELNHQGEMEVRFDADEDSVDWESTLPIVDSFTLTATPNNQWVEQWVVNTDSMWHSEFSGIPQVARSKNDQNSPHWQPHAGETLTITVTRPMPTVGADLAIDNASITYQPGKRASDTHLTLAVRATLGSQLPLALPPTASLKKVLINGRETSISHSESTLKIPVVPGEQTIEVQWQNPVGVALTTTTPKFDLSMPATNINVELNLPQDRWVLLVGGPALGPAILFWGVLLVVVMLAIGLSKSKLTPLKGYEWVLLSVGVATINVWVLVLMAAWFVAMTLRGRNQSPPTKPIFNALQVFLCLLTAVSLLTLVSSVPSSLLANPDMYITGNNSSTFNLRWYQDHSENVLPQGWVISLPMLAYRLLMLLWSLWLAFALMRWIKWGWEQINAGGFWFHPPLKTKNTKPAN